MKRFLLSILFFVGVSVIAYSQNDFRTRQSGNWTNSDTWEERAGGSWVNSGNTPDLASGVITIISPHNVNTSTNLTIDQVVINSGATLSVTGGTTLNIDDGVGIDLTNNGSFSIATGGGFPPGPAGVVNVDGQFYFDGSSNSGTGITRLFFNANSSYEHATDSDIGLPVADWDASSTCSVTGNNGNDDVANLAQTFGNFIWNTPSLGASIDFNGQLNDIQGNLEILNTNGFNYISLSAATASTIDIGGNFIIGSGVYAYVTSTGNCTINVGGDFSYSGAQFFYNNTGDVSFNVTGNYSILNSGLDYTFSTGPVSLSILSDLNTPSVNFSKTGTGPVDITLNGNSVQNLLSDVNSTLDINYRVGDGISSSHLNLNGFFLRTAGEIDVLANSTLDLSDQYIRTGGDFSSSASSFLLIGNTDGISTGTTTGAIRVSGTRTYNTGTTFEYKGTNTQTLGNGFPASGVNLSINNTGGGVDMSSDVVIGTGRTLTLTEGTLNIRDDNLLTINGSVTRTNGGISGGSLSDLTIGGTGAFGTLGFVGTQELRNFTINRTSSGTVTLGGDLTVLGTFEQTAGDFILNGNTFTLDNTFIQGGGTITSDASASLLIRGSGALPDPISISGNIQRLRVNRTGSIFNTASATIAADTLEIFEGDLQYSTGALSVNDDGYVERRVGGTFSNPLNAVGSFDLVYLNNSAMTTGPELPTTVGELNDLTKQGTAVLTLGGNAAIGGTLTLAGGEFNASTFNVDLAGDFVSNANSTLTSATFTFNGTTAQSGSVNPDFGNIIVDNGASLSLSSNLNIEGDLTNNGTLTASSGTINFNGTTNLLGTNAISISNLNITTGNSLTANSSANLALTGVFTNNGTFDANSGTIEFNGINSFVGSVPTLANVIIGVAGTLDAPSSLTVAGNFTNNGSFANNGGVLDLTGSGTRTLGGSSTLALHTLNVSGGTVSNTNSAGITIANGITLGASTTLDADGSGSNQLTLLSTSPTNTAFVGAIPSGSEVIGNMNVQRHFSTGRFYRYTGSAVASTSIADWQQEFPITGTFNDPSTGSADGTNLNSSNPSLFYWDATTSDYVAYPTSGNAASNLIEVGRGYTPFIRNSISNIIGELTGEINQGTLVIPVAYDPNPPAEFGTDSWNLISNPYPAPVDWDAAGWARTNIANEIHVPKTDGSFAVYDGATGTNGGSQNIASGQGFWIRATGGSPAISVDETIKSTGQNPQFFRNEPLEEFRIKLTHKDLSDEIVLVMRDQASFGFDEALDASRRLNINGFGYTLSTSSADGKKMKINSVPKVVESNCSVSIPINMESVTKTGDFNLSFSQVNNLLKYYKVDFIDNYENKVIALDSDYQYSYQINTDAESKSVNRFSLVLNNKDIITLTNLSDVEACASSEVTYSFSNLDPLSKYIIYQGEDKLTELSNQSKASVGISANFLQNSVNNFDVYGQIGTCDSVKVGTFTVNATDIDINLDIKVGGSSICPKATVGNFELNTEDGVSYFILNDSDTIQHISGDGSIYNGTIDMSFLEVGVNMFAIAAEKNECAYGTLTQELEIVVDDFEINQDVLFTSSDACYKNSSFINFTSQSGVDYEILKGAILVTSITGDGTEKKVEIPSSDLSVGFNEFTVLAKHGDCAEYQFPETIEINVEENINKNLSLITENTCGDLNSIILIENAQVGKQYSLMKGDESISSLTATKNGELTFTLNSNEVNTGLNQFDIQIDGSNCETQKSSNQAIFTVQESINNNLQYIAQNACGVENAVIGLSNPQIGKVYKVFKGENLIESKVATEEGNLIFDLVKDNFSIGQNIFNVKIESESCGIKEASQSISLEVYESINADLTVSSTDACAGNNVVIEILNPQVGKTYRLIESKSIIASQFSESTETLAFSFPAEVGSHSLFVDIIDDNCGTVTANQSVEFEVFASAVIENIENQNICLNDEVQVDLKANVPMSNYQLYIGDDLVQENASSTLSLFPAETTTYTITGIPESGCDVNSVNFTVEVTDIAKPGILVSGNILESSIEGDQYQWYLNGEILEKETGKLIVTSLSGDYTVEVFKGNCSILSDSFTFNEEVLNANKALENALNFYPNPVVDKLFVELDHINSINITIFSISGKFMDKFEMESSQSEIDMHKFDKGTYLIQFNAGEASVTKRIVKL